jgi:hypothetical protein
MSRRLRDRNLSDLTPTLAEYILWRAIDHLNTADYLGGKQYPSYGERLEARVILRRCICTLKNRNVCTCH